MLDHANGARIYYRLVGKDTGLHPLPALRNPDSPFGMVLGSMIDQLRGPGAKAAFRKMYTGYFNRHGDRQAAPQAFIAKHLRNVGFAQVYGANHFPHFEQPGQANAAIEAFLARL